MRRRATLGLFVLASVLFATACAGAQPAPTPTTAPSPTIAANPTAASTPTAASATAANGTITVLAAASLTDAFKEMATAYQAANPGSSVTFSFGSSGTLATQLNQGAKADVFASADQTQMKNAVKGGSIAGTPKPFVTNRLTIIVPADNPKGITSLQDLAKPGVKFVAAQAGVPAGQYAEQILTKASQDSTYGSDFKTKVEANFVSRETDVRQIVSKVSLGEGDAAICYVTDVTPDAAPKLKVIPIPDALNVIAVYPIATVKSGANSSGGARFVAFVLSADGKKILAKWGFGPTPT